jgi:hypothetical protein
LTQIFFIFYFILFIFSIIFYYFPKFLTQILRGNTNTYVANVNLLTPSIVASKVRFVPHSQHPRTVCMRVEVFGCRSEDGIVAYQAPTGETLEQRHSSQFLHTLKLNM